MNIQNLRSVIIKKRKELSAEFLEKADIYVLNRVTGLKEYSDAVNLLIYINYNGEMPTNSLIDKALQDGKRVFVPLCKEDFVLDFYEITSIDQLKSGHYGILEPNENTSKIFNSDFLNNKTICIVPGVVFDSDFNRIGYGKGYYDRFFERFNIPIRIGLAYDFQIVPHISAKPTDIKMTKLIIYNDGEY